MTKIKIITDSTCDLPADVAADLGITVVPVYLNVGQQSYRDGLDLTRHDFYTSFPEMPVSPTTAAPGVAAFAAAYQQAIGDGAEGILSIHLAETLSTTINVARQASQLISRIPVWVVDSGQVSLGLGMQAIEAAKAAVRKQPIEDIRSMLAELRRRTYVFAVVDTLEYLRRSGRVARFKAILGSMIKVKPIVSFHDSVIHLENAITTARAFKRIRDLIDNLAPLERISFVHILAASKVDELRELLAKYVPVGDSPYIQEVTPAIGTHIGPGAAGIVCIQA